MEFLEFQKLVEKWSSDNAPLSFERGSHENCKKILEEPNKDDIIGFACLLLGNSNLCHQLLFLLYTLVPDDEQPPIDSFYSGRIPVLLECWKYWSFHRYVESKYDVNSYWVEDKYGNVGNWH